MVSDKPKKVLGFLRARAGRRDREPNKTRSNHDGGDDNRDVGSPRHVPERRESGRFPSAARLLRSLGRSSREDSSGGAQGRDGTDGRLSRSNPSYHSEGKGLKKKNNWTSERELNHSLSPTQKERSHSFCEKSNSASKRRYSYHDNKTLREETRGRLERQESSQGGCSTLASPAPSLDQTATPTSIPLSSQQSPSSTCTTTPPPCTPSPAASSSSPSSSSSSSTTPTLPKSVSPHPPSPIDNSPTENIYENLPPRKAKSDTVNVEGMGGEGGHARPLERAERERRSSRKLTKDSGYETSPYSESDYANVDLYSEVDASGEVEGDGDDVTLAPESELASPPSPSVPHYPDPAAAVPLPPRTSTHPARISHDSLERRCSWQEQSSQDAHGDASLSPAEGRSATPSPRLDRAVQGAPLEANNSFVRNLCGRSSRRSPLCRYSSAESLSSFAESLISPGSTSSGVASSSLVPAKSTPSLHQDASHGPAPARNPAVNVALIVSRSTPNLDDPDDGGSSSSSSMVTKSSMYSYLHGASTSTSNKGGSGAASGRYWDPTMGSDDTPDREDYAHHLRSSSYQMLHSRQLSALSSGSAGSYHSRQHSNASNYSEPDDLSPRSDLHHHSSAAHGHHHHHHGMDRARFFSYDNLGPDASSSTSSQKYHVSWNVSEPDLTLAPPPYSPPGPGFQQVVGPPVSPKVTSPASTSSTSSPTSTSNTTRHPASPPPPPVRDASSLKYIKYGPGHEKYPSWPVPAANQVLTLAPTAHDANVSGLPDSPPQSSTPQGSHRSKSWTEQSEYPKEKAGGYARPYSNKKPASNPPTFPRQLKTVIERSEKNPKEMFHSSGLRDDVFTSSNNYSFMDAYYKPSSSSYYPLYDREGRALDDKDYSIPSPPERDLGMGEASLGQVTAAQLEEYVRRYEEFGYTDLIGTTPLLDQLRRESVMWDGGSERDSGRGESESVAESARYSNGRESVTTVVTNSSSASSSETLKWHGSLSDISIMSGHSRDPRADHNIAHSARVQAPQRHNSESVLYYGPEGRGKGSGSARHTHDTREHHRRPHPTDPSYPRHPREGGKWSREVVERNNEMNNLKKFPSYSYTQPLSQITESPTAEMRETPRSPTRSPQSPTIDFSKPPTVAERIHELERQSRTSGPESVTRWPRDQSGSRERDHQDHRKVREESSLQDPRDTMEKTEARSPREASETRTHQRRGSRDSQRGDRDLRLDFSNTSSRKGDTSIPGMDVLRSPTTPTGSSSSRSPTGRDADNRPFVHENFQNILNSFTEVDRSDRSSGVSYSYLDPEKRRKVPDTTLKSIQKQAVMSFYERHAGRNLGAGADISSSGSQSSLASSHSAPETPQGKWNSAPHPSQGQNLRTDKSGRAGKGVARLGRVPESEDDQPLRPGRRRSSGRLDSSSELSAEDASRGGSQRSSLASESASSRGEQPPALPQKMSLQSHPEGSPWSSPTLPPTIPAPEDTTTPTTTTNPGEEQTTQDASEDDKTYHKDSYMAHRRDWKTGFEGRYRRTISPSGSSRNLVSSTLPATTTSTSSTQALPHPTSPITATTTTTTTTTTTCSSLIGQNDMPNETDNIANENGWSNGSHMRNTSTTVSFTAEELRAFKARRAHAQDLSTHIPDKENASRKLHSSQSSPSLSSSALQSVASEGSTSSLASGGSGRSAGSVCSGGVSPVSPSKLSPAHSWRTSLESLNRANSTAVTSNVSNGNSTSSSSHSPRTITRATSLADPLHSSEEVGMSGRATQDSYQLPRTASINESLSRITAISDSLSRSTSVADSLAGQSLAAETHSQGINAAEVLLPGQSAEPPSLPLAPASPSSPVAHDGPVTARPATVTEEATSPVTPSVKTAQVSPLSLTSKSSTSPKSTPIIHPQATLTSKPTTPVTTSSTSSESMNSSPTTCPSSTDANSNSDVVVLGYGRTPYPEELECERLSKDYVPQLPMDNKLRALFAPGPEHKTTAHYMEGVFSLELRKDFISGSHARHPDLVQVGLSRTVAPKSITNTQNNNETSNGVDTTNDRTPLPADSAYFTTSESKAKMLTRLRGSSGNLQESLTDQQLNKKKEELVASIGRKLEILRAEHEAIKDEMRINQELGSEVTSRVEALARLAESEKYKLHVEEIDKITSLLLGLSGRLARAENALMMVDDNDPEEKRVLENKRDKLREQLEEAKKLKENIDRRAVQVSKVLNKYLTEDQYADYDHFIKMKAKLIMDAREIDDKMKLGEEQQKALRETMFKKQ